MWENPFQSWVFPNVVTIYANLIPLFLTIAWSLQKKICIMAGNDSWTLPSFKDTGLNWTNRSKLNLYVCDLNIMRRSCFSFYMRISKVWSLMRNIILVKLFLPRLRHDIRPIQRSKIQVLTASSQKPKWWIF